MGGRTHATSPALFHLRYRRSPLPKQTPLYATHVAAGAKIVDFAGWDMPIHYGSQLEEHKTVRADAGMFDVSHMLPVDITGAGAPELDRSGARVVGGCELEDLDPPGGAVQLEIQS